MQQKVETRAFEQVASILQPGEQPITGTRAMAGKFSAGRLSSVVTNGLIAEAGLLGAALSSTRKQFVVVTDRRVLFLSQTFMGGAGKKLLGEVPREQVSLAEAKIGAVSLVRIAFGTAGDGVSLTFPMVDKKNAQALADALQPTSVA